VENLTAPWQLEGKIFVQFVTATSGRGDGVYCRENTWWYGFNVIMPSTDVAHRVRDEIDNALWDVCEKT